MSYLFLPNMELGCYKRYLEMLEVGQTYGPGNVNSIRKPTEGEKALVTGNEG
jgi:hypothetical protein